MQVLVIPGYSISNKEWAKTTAQKLGGQTFEWTHWTNPNSKFDPQNEAQKIIKIIGDTKINLVVKSIGTYVLMLALDKIKINKLIICGICINDLNEKELESYKILKDFDYKKVIVFQNSDDKHGSFNEVKSFLASINPHIF